MSLLTYRQIDVYSTGRGESHGYLNEMDPCPYSVFHETVAASFLLSLSLPLPSLFSLPPLSSRSSPSRSVSTEAFSLKCFSQSSLFSSFSRNFTSPKQSHRNQLNEMSMSMSLEKSLLPAGIEPGSSLSTRECVIHLAMMNPQNTVEKMFYLIKRKREKERKKEKKERER